MPLRSGYEEKAAVLSASIIVGGVILATQVQGGMELFLVASLAAGLIVLMGDGLARTITLLLWGIIASTTSWIMLPLSLLAGYVAGSTYMPLRVRLRGATETMRLAVIPAFYTPILIVYPVSIFPLSTYTLALLVEWMMASSRLSRIKAIILEREKTIPYGEEALFLIRTVAPPGVFHYEFSIDGKIRGSGTFSGEETLSFKVKPGIIGVERHRVLLILADGKGRARRIIGPITVRVKSILSSHKALLRIRRVLQAYRELIGKPLVYRGVPPRIAVEVEGWETGGGVMGEGAGEEGKGSGMGDEGVGVAPSLLPRIILPVEEVGGEPNQYYEWVPVLQRGEYGGGSAYLGDYKGVREYRPGDKPTRVHWKKSVSRSELVVKTYEGGSMGGGGGGKLLIVADWVSRNPEELDELVKKTYSAILHGVGEKILVLRTPNGSIYLVRGGVPEVLAGLDDILRGEGLLQKLNYGGWRRENIAEVFREMVREGGVLSKLVRYHIAYSRALASSLERMGVEKGIGFTIIYSDATAFRNQALYEVLRNSYAGEVPVPDIPIEEVAERLKNHIVAYRV